MKKNIVMLAVAVGLMMASGCATMAGREIVPETAEIHQSGDIPRMGQTIRVIDLAQNWPETGPKTYIMLWTSVENDKAVKVAMSSACFWPDLETPAHRLYMVIEGPNNSFLIHPRPR
jgi:hypothetical protein